MLGTYYLYGFEHGNKIETEFINFKFGTSCRIQKNI